MEMQPILVPTSPYLADTLSRSQIARQRIKALSSLVSTRKPFRPRPPRPINKAITNRIRSALDNLLEKETQNYSKSTGAAPTNSEKPVVIAEDANRSQLVESNESRKDRLHLPPIKGNSPGEVLLRVYSSSPVADFKRSPAVYKPKKVEPSQYRIRQRDRTSSPFATTESEQTYQNLSPHVFRREKYKAFTPILRGRRSNLMFTTPIPRPSGES